jgi:hypothetical protein
MMIMSRNGVEMFDPFERHRPKPENQPDQPRHEIAAATAVEEKSARSGNPFSHLKAEPKVRPEPERTREPLPPQVLLTWLRDNWTKPVISLRDLQVFGPSGIRDRKSALAHAETLERYGWLVPIKAHRRDRRMWMLPPARATALDEN